MAVEQRTRTAAVFGFADHNRMAGSWTHADLEPQPGEILRQMFRGFPALLPIRRIGGDRANAQKAEQAIEAAVEVLVDAVENLVEHAHGFLLPPVGGSIVPFALADSGFIAADQGAFQSPFLAGSAQLRIVPRPQFWLA